MNHWHWLNGNTHVLVDADGKIIAEVRGSMTGGWYYGVDRYLMLADAQRAAEKAVEGFPRES